MSATASIAIENTQLYQQQSTNAAQLATLNKVGTLLSGTLSPTEVFDIIISSASTITEAHAVALYISQNNQLNLIKGAGLSDYFLSFVPAFELAKLHQAQPIDLYEIDPIVVSNVHKLNKQNNSLYSMMLAEKKQAWVELPLKITSETLGVLVVFFDEPQNFSDEKMSLMEAFATQASQAINNAQTFSTTDKALETRIEQLSTLEALGRQLNVTLDTQKICEIILESALDKTHATTGYVTLIDHEHHQIEFLAQSNHLSETILIDTIKQGLNGQVLNTIKTLRVDDLETVEDDYRYTENSRSVLIVPFSRKDQCIGLIRLESPDLNAFTDGDIHFVSQIINQALTSMNNAALFQRVLNARDNLQTILDGMEEGIVMINPQKVITIANPTITMLGINPEELIQQSIDDVINKQDIDIVRRFGFNNKQALLNVIDHLDNSALWHQQFTREYDIMLSDGSHTFIKRLLIPISDTDDTQHRGLIMVFYNKTEEKKLVQARDALTQMIVHDLRSPLTAVTTSLSLLRSIGSKDETIAAIIDKTTSASQQAITKVLTRINSILDISKLENGDIDLSTEPGDLMTIVDNVLISISPVAHDMNVKILNQVNETIPLLHIDKDKIERVLQNLLDNALKYSPQNSEIIISTSSMDAHFLQINIQDSGPGIPDQYKQSVFNRFSQIAGRKTGHGSVGLGLTFCRLVTEAHGGEIWIEDAPGGGSIFSLTLPIHETCPEPHSQI